MRGTLAIAALLLAGCVRPVQPFDGGGERSSTDAVRKVESQDGSDPWSLLGEGCRLPDGCVECEPLAGEGGCTGSATDGLPAERDPWPSLCKRRLFADDFREMRQWSLPYNSEDVVYGGPIVGTKDSCGLMHLAPPEANFTVPVALKAGKLSPTEAGYLVEMRLSSPRAPSTVRLWADVTGPGAEAPQSMTGISTRACHLARQFGQDTLESRVGPLESATVQRATVLALPEGWLILQSYFSQNDKGELRHVCRLFQGSKLLQWVDAPVALASAVPASGNVRPAFVNDLQPGASGGLLLYVDWLRIYEGPR